MSFIFLLAIALVSVTGIAARILAIHFLLGFSWNRAFSIAFAASIALFAANLALVAPVRGLFGDLPEPVFATLIILFMLPVAAVFYFLLFQIFFNIRLEINKLLWLMLVEFLLRFPELTLYVRMIFFTTHDLSPAASYFTH
jgi:hypothetical protein